MFKKLFVKLVTIPCIQAAQVDRGDRTLRSCGLWAPFTVQNVLVYKMYRCFLDEEASTALRNICEEIAYKIWAEQEQA